MRKEMVGVENISTQEVNTVLAALRKYAESKLYQGEVFTQAFLRTNDSRDAAALAGMNGVGNGVLFAVRRIEELVKGKSADNIADDVEYVVQDICRRSKEKSDLVKSLSRSTTPT